MATELSIEDRRTRASDLLARQGFMSLAELVQNLGVSESTIRRDLEILEEHGLIKRTHGGAVCMQESGTHRLAFSDRETTAAAEKQAIAKAIAQLIPENQTVILDGGTTCFQVARALQSRRLNVITNSVHVASLLSTDLATEVTLLGGYVYPRTGVALGSMAMQMLEGLHATQLVLSCAGVTEEGAYNSNQMMVEVERRMIQIAEQVILAADHTKFGMRAVVKLCDLASVDVIVTDAAAPQATREWLSRTGRRVIYAE